MTPAARLLKRLFNFDVSICNKCSGNTKVIAVIEDPKAIKKILNQLGHGDWKKEALIVLSS